MRVSKTLTFVGGIVAFGFVSLPVVHIPVLAEERVPATLVSGARNPTATDVSQLTALVARPQATITSIAIVGNYAEICWLSGNIGGAVLATNTSGSWAKVASTHGGYTATDITSAVPGIPAATASALASQAALNQT
jgi:hypothetical protein